MISTPGSQQTLFRPAALAKIRSPEQLDALLPITSPIGWVALLTIGLALTGVVIWSFTGTILRTAKGQGVIMRDSNYGIFEVSGQGTGTITKMLVETGDVVRVGQPIAEIDLSQAQAQLANARDSLEKLHAQDNEQTNDEKERLKIINEKLANQEDLYKRGLITKTPVLETRNAIYEVHARSYQRRQMILEQELRIREMQIKYDQESVVRAAHEGRVLEVPVSPGNFVQPGKAVARLESIHGEYEAIVYIPVLEGKKVKTGMSVRLSPSIVKPEEYGYILGNVEWVSSYPVTEDYLMNELGSNQNLVQSLMQGGSAIELLVNMEDDDSTPSGFRWSSPHGPDVKIESGTVCQVSIVLERVRPITLLVPFLKKQMGLF